MADKRAYFKLDVGYLTNPKVAEVAAESATAVILHIGSIAYSAQHLTDGLVPIALLLRLTGATPDDAELLTAHGLWTRSDKGHALVHDFLEHQRSATEAKGATEKAKRAAAARWTCDDDASSNASGMLNALLDASEGAMPRERERKKERSTTTAVTDPAGFDAFWAVYPRKADKGHARPAWTKALTKTTAETIIAGATRLAADPNLDKQFVPNPATWLNGERWGDEALPIRLGGVPNANKPVQIQQWQSR